MLQRREWKHMDLTILAPIGAVLALLFALFQAKKVMKEDEGTDLMKSLSQKIRTGADAYLKRQYKSVAVVFVVLVVIFTVLAFFGQVNMFVPIAFVTGGVFSALSGYIGMKIATAANARTANAAHHSLNKGLKVAFSAGSVMGFTVVGLGLLDTSIWFYILKMVYGDNAQAIASALVTFGMGASTMALFARVGGGIFNGSVRSGYLRFHHRFLLCKNRRRCRSEKTAWLFEKRYIYQLCFGNYRCICAD